MTPEELEAKRKADEEQAAKEKADREAKLKALLEGEQAELIKELVSKQVEENLKPVKEKLDNAYKQRDTVLKENEDLKRKQDEARIEALKSAGKEKEALEEQLKQEKERREALEKTNTELRRDTVVRAGLTGIPFKNEKAADLAYREIVGDLVQNSKGEWVNKDGSSIQETINRFIKDEGNAFLLKTKANSGGGSKDVVDTNNTPPEKKKSLFELPVDQVVKMAEEGKLGPQKRY